MKREPMKKEYDLKKLKPRSGRAKVFKDAVKTAINIRLDGAVLAALQTEAYRMGIPYQTFIGSILHRYAANELIDKKTIDLLRRLRPE